MGRMTPCGQKRTFIARRTRFSSCSRPVPAGSGRDRMRMVIETMSQWSRSLPWCADGHSHCAGRSCQLRPEWTSLLEADHVADRESRLGCILDNGAVLHLAAEAGRCRQLRGSAQCSLASPQRCPGPAGRLAPAGRPALLQLPRRGGCAPAHVRGGRLHTGGGSDCGPRSRFLRSGRGWKNSSGLPRGRERIQRGGVSINAPMSCNSCCRCEEGHCT